MLLMTPTPSKPDQASPTRPALTMPWTRSGEPGPWRRAVVYGLGLSGRAAADWLLKRGVDVVAFDQRSADEIAADPSFDALRRHGGLRLELGAEPGELPNDLAWDDVDALILSPGVPADRPLVAAARDAALPVLTEVELAFPFLQGTVVAITGSNGKSTTTALAAVMISQQAIFEGAGGDDARKAVACGNIGEPVIRFAAAGGSERTFVIELSSFQLESVDLFRPKAAALLNVAADHLDRYASLDDYRRAKLNIFRRQQAGDVAILNADDPSVVAAAPELRAHCRYFSRQIRVADGCYLDGDRVMEASPERDEPRSLFRSPTCRSPASTSWRTPWRRRSWRWQPAPTPSRLVDGLRGFRGLPHRLERVAELDGVTFYDDSKGTNPAAVVKSLEGFDDALGASDPGRTLQGRRSRRAGRDGRPQGGARLSHRRVGGAVCRSPQCRSPQC